jgi:glycosyltransferase involved in cell wall biosynthesis
LQQQREQDPISGNRTDPAPRLGIQESRLIIGIPTYNEEDSIARTIVRLSGIGDVVICDDGSTDATEDIGRALGCKIIKHPRKLGRSDCITSLFLAARRLGAGEMITLATDTSFTIEDLETLLEAVRSGDCDIAIGSRLIDSIRDSGAAGGLSDPESLLTVYGKRAIAMIAPAGTTSVVMESDVVEFANQQGLKVKEYPRMDAVESPRLTVKEKNTQPSLDRITSLIALKYPFAFFGIPSLGILGACVVEAFLSLEIWITSGLKPDFEFGVYYGFALLISVCLGMTSVILESQRIVRSKSRAERSAWVVRVTNSKTEKTAQTKSGRFNLIIDKIQNFGKKAAHLKKIIANRI